MSLTSFSIKVGQRIIEVNGQSLLGASHNEAVSALREVGDNIELLVCDGWNTPTNQTLEPEPRSNHDRIDAVSPQLGTTNGENSSSVSVSVARGDLPELQSSDSQEKVSHFLFNK